MRLFIARASIIAQTLGAGLLLATLMGMPGLDPVRQYLEVEQHCETMRRRNAEVVARLKALNRQDKILRRSGRIAIRATLVLVAN